MNCTSNRTTKLCKTLRNCTLFWGRFLHNLPAGRSKMGHSLVAWIWILQFSAKSWWRLGSMHFSNAGPLHIEIGEYAFFKCRSLAHIVIPPAVRVIKYANFLSCLRLPTMILSVEMEEIGERSFKGCAFVRIIIPPSVRAFKEGAFKDCSWLTTAILNNGLEEIGKQAFKECAFVRIDIPSAVREIDEMAFKDCSN